MITIMYAAGLKGRMRVRRVISYIPPFPSLPNNTIPTFGTSGMAPEKTTWNIWLDLDSGFAWAAAVTLILNKTPTVIIILKKGLKVNIQDLNKIKWVPL